MECNTGFFFPLKFTSLTSLEIFYMAFEALFYTIEERNLNK